MSGKIRYEAFFIMENIREEETEPLAASPPRRMAEAYSHNDRRR